MYGYYAAITIDHTKVSGTSNFSNFAVLISGIYDGTGGEPNLKTVANSGHVQNTASGGNSGSVTVPADLAFYNDASRTTQYDHEIEYYNATTGEIIAWVRVPTLSYTTDTLIYMFYGDSGVSTSQENVNGTWNANYQGVYHFNSSSKDSTSNARHGTDTSMSYGSAYGKIGSGSTYAGSSWTNVGTGFNTTMTSNAWTLFIWPKETADTGTHVMMAVDHSSGVRQFTFASNGANHQLYFERSGSATGLFASDGAGQLSASVHKMLIVTYDGTSIRSYFDGAIDQTKTMSALPSSGNNMYFGRREYTGSNIPYKGDMDEIRILNVTVTQDWITTTYNSHNSPSTFYSMGSETSAVSSAVKDMIQLGMIPTPR